MSYTAYGLSQGFTQGSDNINNSIATAERIKNNREQLRIQNQYLQLAQDKWDVAKQQENIAIKQAQMKLDSLENEMVANRASNFLIDGYEYGNYKQFQNFALTNEKMKQILDTLGIVNIEGLNDYTDSSIDSIAGDSNIANQVRQHRNGYLVATDTQGNKSLIDTMLLAGQMGVQKYVNMNRVERMNALQSRMLEQAQTSAVKAQTQQAMEDPLNYTTSKAVEQWAIANPAEAKGLVIAAEQAKSSDRKRKVDYEMFNKDANAGISDFFGVLTSPDRPTDQQSVMTFSKGLRLGKKELGLNSIEDALNIVDDPNASQEAKAVVNQFLSSLESVKPKTAKDVDTFLVNSEIYKTVDNFDKLVKDLEGYDPTALAPTDKIVQSVAKYFNVDGKEALDIIKNRELFSNFQTITNTIRHALYGAQLTPKEIESFEAAVGAVGQSKSNLVLGIQNLLMQSKSTYDEGRRKNVEWFDWKHKGNYDKISNALNSTIKLIDALKSGKAKSPNTAKNVVNSSTPKLVAQPQQTQAVAKPVQPTQTVSQDSDLHKNVNKFGSKVF